MAVLSKRIIIYGSSDSGVSWWIGILIAGIVVSILSIIIRIMIIRRRASRLNAIGTQYIGNAYGYPQQTEIQQQGAAPYPSFEMSKVAEGQGVWNDKMEPEAEKRRTEEADLTSGRRVWYSRYWNNGSLQRWALIVDGTRYELNFSRGAQDYTYNVSECTIEQERVYAKELSQESTSHDQQYFVCMIGWTKYTQQEIDAVVATLHPQYGSQTLPANNAHQFFSGLAGRIVAKKALDWGWFSDNVRFPVTSQQTLPAVPAGLVQRNLGESNTSMAAPQQAHVHGDNTSYNNSPYMHRDISPTHSTALLTSTDHASESKSGAAVTVQPYDNHRYA